MCIDLDSDPYLKGQGHTRHLKVRVHMLVLKLTYVCMDGLPSNLEQMLSPLKCDNIFITSVFSSKAVKQFYDITTIYMYHFIENTLKACYFIDVTNQGLIFLHFLAKITLTLILPTLHTI